MTSTPSPTSQNVRLTISVTPEVYDTYKRLADAGSMSMSRAMGEWLEETIEAASFMAQKMEEARAAPKRVLRELHAYALGAADEVGALVDQLRQQGREDRAARAGSAGMAAGASRAVVPPSGNTGGKGTKTTKARTRGSKS